MEPNSYSSAADAADVSNPCLDIIVGAAGLAERKIVQKINSLEPLNTYHGSERNGHPSVGPQRVIYHIIHDDPIEGFLLGVK